MKYQAEDEKQIVEYLLGRLSEEGQAQVEERFIRDYEYLERLRAVEEDLNDSYVRGELAGREREQFEQRIAASPEWQQRVEFARALSALGPAAPQAAAAQAAPASRRKSLLGFLRSQNLAFNFALATLAVTILVAGTWLVLETRRLRAEVRQLQADRQQTEQREQQLRQQTTGERERAGQLAQDLERERAQRERIQTELEKRSPLRSVIALVLMPGVGRGEEDQTSLAIPPGAGLVRLDLYLQGPTPYKGYRAELRTTGGQLIWSAAALAARQTRLGKAVALSLPASAFAAGKYEVALRGITSSEQVEDVGYYYFSVVKK